MLKLHQLYFLKFLVLLLFLFLAILIEVIFIKEFSYLIISISLSFLIFIVGIYFQMNKNIVLLQDEVDKIFKFLKNLTKKEKNTFLDSSFSEEFKKITKLLSKVSHILIKQEESKNRYTEKLEVANSQKDEIISAISHEFKNPIAVINGYSQTLLNDENLPKSLRKKFLRKIYRNGEKLTNLIDTLRLAIKLDENTQKINFKKIDLYDLTKEVIEDIKDSYDREIKLFGDKLFVKVDIILMEIAIKNLIENAIKYSESEVLVIIKNDSLSVIDKGIGIASSDIQKITQKFYRVTNNSWNNSLGLGLSIVKNIVKLHNFRLEIKSKLHQGSEFIIWF